MSGQPKCQEPKCTFYASANSKYCSEHTPAGRARREAAAAAAAAEKAAQNKAFRLQLDESAFWFERLPLVESPQAQCLVLGATPDEERRGRTHYENPNVWLLGYEAPKNQGGIDYRRYIIANYDGEHADELAMISNRYVGRFNQLAFDFSTMCPFTDSPESMAKRFRSFNTMLQSGGILFLERGGPEITQALLMAGFTEPRAVRVSDVRTRRTIINDLTDFTPEHTVYVAIKRDRGYGGKRGTRRRRGISRKNRNRKFR